MNIYSLIPEGMYRELTQKTNLHQMMRNLFSPIDSLAQFDNLIEDFNRLRQGFVNLQPEMIKGISTNLVRHLPIRFIKDNTSRSGASYLRWRNFDNTKNGQLIVQEVLSAPTQPSELKGALLQAEKERIVLNMQMAITVHILRQLKECRDKLAQVENITTNLVGKA
ncbi:MULTISPECIES: DUF3158 family protein [Avibacterium]|nr:MULTISPECIES: DUF3158 family protein [Avibacterium]MCW9718570.1 DUF3158 family protein [Avibacterium sp. 21-599]